MGIYTKTSGEKVYTFSSKPRIPGDGVPNVLVKFQAVSRTEPCVAHHYFKLNSHTKLSRVRRHINPVFKNYFNNGFIFLSKTKEILRSGEANLTVFDILPKLPGSEVNTSFLFPDVQYKQVSHDFEGRRHFVVCACVVYMYEASKVSHWEPDRLRDDLSANTIEGFCYIPTDIMSWRQNVIECRGSSLHQKAAVGIKEDVKTSLQQLPADFRLNALKDQRGANPLHYAAENGHLEICELLVTGLGRDIVNQRDMNFRTPLHCALYRKRASTVTYLLQLGSNLTSIDIHGDSCLDLLASQKSEDLQLIISKLQFDCIEPILQYFLAQLHLKKKHLKIVKQMSRQLHQITEEEDSWKYLLHYAAEIGDRELTENLIDKGCSIQTVDVQGLYPFHHACMNGNQHVELFFFQQITDDDFCLGLRFALQRKHYSLCHTIKQLKSDIALDEQTMCLIIEVLDRELEKVRYNKLDLKCWESIAKNLLPFVAEDKDVLNTFVFDCAFYGAVETLILLKSLGANFKTSDHMGRSPLHEACQRNHTKAVDILLRGGADLNATDWRKSTPLHYACAKGHDKVVSKLMKEVRIKAAVQDSCGRTPFLVSAYHKRHDIICILLRDFPTRINILAEDVYGNNILHYAVHINQSCLDILFDKIRDVEKKAGETKNGNADWFDGVTCPCWYRGIVVTDFSSQEDWKDLKRQMHFSLTADEWIELKRQKQITMFSNTRERTTWASRPIITANKPKTFKKGLYRCKLCNKFLAAKSSQAYIGSPRANHACQRNKSSDDPEEKRRKRFRVRPFQFHSSDFSDGSTPVYHALRMGQYQLMKKLNRIDPRYKSVKDDQNRNLLWFAVEQENKTMIKMAYDLLPGGLTDGLISRFVIQILRNSKSTSKKQLLEYLLSIGGSADDSVNPDDAVFGFSQKEYCSVVEFAAFKGSRDIFDLLLEKSTKFNENYCLGVAVYGGHVGIIDSLLKRRIKRKIAMLLRHQIGPVLDIACCSTHLSLKMVESLIKICPDIVYNAQNSDGATVKLVGCEVDWPILRKGTTLANLLSSEHPMRTKKRKTEIENVAKFLIKSGINLENADTEGKGGTGSHSACEAYICAVNSGYHQIAALILEKVGHSIWKCAAADGDCFNFQKKELETGSADSRKEINALEKHIYLACASKVPMIWLKALIDSWKEYLTNSPRTFPREGIQEEKLQKILEAVDNPICKELLFVINMLFEIKSRSDILRLLKLVPVLYPYIHMIDEQMFPEPANRSSDSLILHRCVKLAFRKLRTKKFKAINMENDITLLHVICSCDNTSLVKDMISAVTPIDVNTRTKNGVQPIDIAAACGSWTVYRTLVGNGADVTEQTLVACCAAERFADIGTWTSFIHGFQFDTYKDESLRLKIIKDICSRNIDVLFEHEEYGSAITNAVVSKFWDILEYFNKGDPRMLLSCLKENGQIARQLIQFGPESLIQSTIDTLNSNGNAVNVSFMGEMLLGASRKSTDSALVALIKVVSNNFSTEDWTNVLSIFDTDGFSTIHNAARLGFYEIVVTLSSKIGSYRRLEQVWKENRSGKHRVETPLWYALCNQHWDIAKCLLLFGANPVSTRAVPDLYTKRRFSVMLKDKSRLLDNTESLKYKEMPQYFFQYRKPFPHLTNTSHGTASAIAPNIECFTKRSKEYICVNSRERLIFRTECKKIKFKNKEKRKDVKEILKFSNTAKIHDGFLIHVACATGHVGLVKALMELHPDVAKLKDGDGLLPIVYAVAGGKLEIIDEMKCDLDSKNALELMKALLWKFMMNDSRKGRKRLFIKKNRFELILSDIKPLIPKEDKSENNGQELSIESERVNAFLQTLKQVRDTICTENVFKHWSTISRLNPEKIGSYLTDDTSKSIMVDAMRNIDVRQLTPVMWIALMACGRPWVLQTIMDIWSDDDRFTSKINGRFFGEFSLIDMILMLAESNNQQGIQNSTPLQEKYKNVISQIFSKSNLPVKEEIILIAVKKNMWIVLEEIAKKKVQNLSDLTPLWHRVMIECISKSNNLSLFCTITECIGLYKLDENSKKEFHAYECLASLYGRDDVIKYLFKCNIPFGSTTENMEVMNHCNKRYPRHWNVLHYAVKGGSVQTFDLILRFLKYDVSFLKSTNLSELLSLAFSLRNQDIQEKIVVFLEKHMETEMTLVNWELIFLNTVKCGNDEAALHIIDERRVDITICDDKKRNALHYAAILGSSKLVIKLLDNDISKDLHVVDEHGLYPTDYAIAFGKTELMKVLFDIKKFTFSDNQDFHGCLRGILESNGNFAQATNNSKEELLNFSQNTIPSDSFLERLIRRSDDRSACFIVEHFRYIILRNKAYTNLYNLAARYGCRQTVVALGKVWDMEMMNVALSESNINLNPMEWAIRGMNTEFIEIVRDFDKEKISCTLTTKATGESILHNAVKTGRQEIVKMIDEWSDQQLRDHADSSGITPIALAVALGEHHLLPVLTQTTIHCQHHSRHIDDEIDFTCVECLLDLGIGWIKCFHRRVFGADFLPLDDISRAVPASYPSRRGFVPVRRFQYKGLGFLIENVGQNHIDLLEEFKEDFFVWKRRTYGKCLKLPLTIHKLQSLMEWTDLDCKHMLVSSLMTVMGYQPDEISTRTLMLRLEERNIQSCPRQKMLRAKLSALVENNISKHDSHTAYMLYETAASMGNKEMFSQNTDHFESLIANLKDGNMTTESGLSLSEIAYGFGNADLGMHLESSLIKNGSTNIYSSFKEMIPALPVQLLWALQLEVPGDDNWNIAVELESNVRLLKSEILLASKLPHNILNKLGTTVDASSLIPSTCQGKKCSVDIESFKKQPCFLNKSDVWIKCLMASSLIYGHVFNLLQYQDTKISSATSVQIRCLPDGSGEHPKTSIESNGVIVETVGISKTRQSITLEHDKLLYQRSTDSDLKQSILQKVIPDVQLNILEVFGHHIDIKIDWRSVESQRRTSGSVSILKILKEGNRLAGLEDVISHCKEMKQEIADIFNEKTAEYAITPMSTVHEITIKYVDTLPSIENTPQSKYSTLIPNCTWNFSIDRSTLKYDRTSFPLWSYLNLYKGSCVSLSHPATLISFKDSETFLDNESIPKPEKPLSVTLEIDFKSFGAYSISSLHKLISRKIEDEISHIAHLSHAMLRLAISAEHIVIQNTSSTKHTGVNSKGGKTIISVYAHQHKSNEWTISSENALATIAELEDKQLTLNATPEFLKEINKKFVEVQENVIEQTGLQLKISLDEKKLLVKTFQRYRREMSHPYQLIKRSMELIHYYVPILYRDIISLILHSPSTTFCRLLPIQKHSHMWYDIPVRSVRKIPEWRNEIPEIGERFQFPSAIWTSAGKESNESLDQNVLTLVKNTTKDQYWSQRITVDYGIMKGSQLRNFPKQKTKDTVVNEQEILGTWINKEIKNPVASMKTSSCEYFMYENALYKLLDGTAMLEILTRIRCHEMANDLIVGALENGFETYFRENMLPDFQKTVSSICLPKHVLTQDDGVGEISIIYHRLPVSSIQFISIDWRSFCYDKENVIQSERFLRNTIYCFLDAYLILCKEFGLIENEKTKARCGLQKEYRDILQQLLSLLQFRIKRLKVDIGKNDLKSKNENVEMFFKSRNQVLVEVKEEPGVEIFASYFYLVIIRALEMEMLSIVSNFQAEMHDTKTSSRKQVDLNQKVIVRKGKLNLCLIFQLHCNLKSALATLLEMDGLEDKSRLKALDDMCYLKSKETAINVVDGCLKVFVSETDISQNTLLKCLIAFLSESSDTVSVVDAVLFNLAGPEMYFSCPDVNVISLKATDRNRNHLSDLRKEILSVKEAYRIRIWKKELNEMEEESNKTTVFANSVNIEDDKLTITWNGQGVQCDGITNIEVLNHERHLNLPKTTIYLKSSESSKGVCLTKCGKIKMEKDGFVTIFLEHDVDKYVNVNNSSLRVNGNIPAKKNFNFHKIDISDGNDTKVRFELFVRAKKYYTNADRAVDIIKVGSKGNWKGVYKLTCINSNRSVRIRAICKLCRRYLRVVIPQAIVEPGKEMLIN